MNGSRTRLGDRFRLGRRSAAFAVALSLPLGAGCSSLAPRVDQGRPTALMKQTGTTMSAVELRRRVDGMVAPLLAFIELDMDRVREQSDDPEVRRRALLLKIDAVPVVYRAAFQPDPLAGILDLWLLAYQMERCLAVGEGPCALGDQQAAASETARDMRVQFEKQLFEVTEDREILALMKDEVKTIADRYPLTGEGAIARRYTMTEEAAAALGSESRDAFSVVGDVSMTLGELSNRLNTYIGDAGRLGRWHAELLAEDLLHRPEVARSLAAVGELEGIGGSLESIERTLEPEGVASLVDELRQLVRGERRAILADVERQRDLTLDYVSAERALVLEAVYGEREAILDRIHQERVATLADLDRLGEVYLDATTARAFRVVDHLIWRLAQLLGGLLLLAALLVWLVLRTGGLRLGASAARGPGTPSS